MNNISSFCCALLIFGCWLPVHAQELLSLSDASQVYVASPEGDFTAELMPGKNWSFKTSVGKIKVPLSGIDSIQFSADGASVDVHTLGGDRWVTELPDDLIKAVNRDEGRSVGGMRFIHPVVETNQTIEALWRFVLFDQSVFTGNIVDQALKVDGGLSPISLPFDEIYEVSSINREDKELGLRTVLSSGQVYMLKPLQSRITVADRLGNTLKIALVDLVSVSMTVEDKRVQTPALPQRIRCTLEGQAERAYEIPGSLIRLETVLGSLTLSSSELLELRRKPNSKEVWIQTVYGDVLVGKLAAKTWRFTASSDDEDAELISTRKIAQLNFDNKPVYVKNRQWWHLADGSRLRGEFKRPSYRLRLNKGGASSWENIPSSSVHLLEPSEEGRIVIAAGHKRFSIRPIAAEFDMILDYNSKGYALPWSNLLRVEKLEEQKLPLIEWMSLLEPEYEGMATQERVPEVLIEAGSFWMGRQGGFGLDDEQPAHKVNLNTFYIDQYEVSLADFKRFVEAKKYTTEAERSGAEFDWSKAGFPQEENEPVVYVSWFDAVAYCNWRSREAGLQECYSKGPDGERVCDFTSNGYRLPTEAEWEFVASERGAAKRFTWGESEEVAEAIAHANFSQPRSEPFDGFVWTSPVDAFPANALGVFGMSGNVWEWCEDWYHHDAYFLVHRRKTENPVVLSGDAPGLSHKVMRSGSFKNEVDFLRCASRGSGLPIGFADRIGFRCVRGIASSEEN